MDKETIEHLGALILPKEVFNHFELVEIADSAKQVDLFLDERSNPPQTTGFSSKGFTEQAVIQDFPIRGKAVYLHIRRRKWLDHQTNKIVTSSYDLAHLGTQITQEFSDFLKGFHRKLRH